MNLPKLFLSAAKMPELKHAMSNEECVEVGQSDVADWLCAQPEIRAAVFFLARNYGAIGFDDVRRTWKGDPEIATFVPFSEEEIRGELAEPKKLYNLLSALQEKYTRPADQFAMRLCMRAMERRGTVVVKEMPGWRGRMDRWYGLKMEDFGEANEKVSVGRKDRLTVEGLVTLLEGEGPLTSRQLVEKIPNFSRSVVYARLANARNAGLVRKEGETWMANGTSAGVKQAPAATDPDLAAEPAPDDQN